MKKNRINFNLIKSLILVIISIFFASSSLSASVRKVDIPQYKPLEIYGEKIFTLDDVDVKGNFSRFATENFDAIPGFRYSSQLRLTLDGNLARNVSINAQIDDTNLDREEKKITLKINGNNFLATLGDFQTSFSDTIFTLYNKKLKGIELYTWLPNVGEATIIASRSEGKSESEIFTGAGLQSEFLLTYNPVIKESEVIKIDGILLKKGTDYDIDYEDGSFSIDQRLLPLESSSRIEVEYEYYQDGSMYRRTLLGLRVKAFKSPTDYIGASILSDADEKNSPEGVEDPASISPPNATRVAGVDFHLSGPKNTELSGEYAFSSFDPNTLTKNQAEGIKSGHAGKVDFLLNDEKIRLNLIRIEMDPKFDSIGKERLVQNRELTSLNLKLMPVKIFDFNFSGDVGRSNNLGDPDIPASSSDLVSISDRNLSGTFTYKPSKKDSLTFAEKRRIKKNRDQNIHFDEQVNEAKIKKQTGIFVNTLRYNVRKIYNDYLQSSNRFENTIEGGISGEIYKKTRLSINASRIAAETGKDKIKNSDIDNINLNFTSTPSRKFFASAALGQRTEKFYLDDRKDSTLTGDMKLRYSPIDNLQIQGRYKEIQTKKFVINYHDNLEKVLNQSKDSDNILRVNEPVSTATSSLLFNYFPSPQTSAIAQYQYKNITNLETKKQMAVSDNALLEFKVNPRKDIITILKSMLSRNKQITGSAYETSSDMHEFEIRKNLKNNLSIIGGVSLEKLRDSYNLTQEMDKISEKIKLEKTVNSSVFVHGGYTNGNIERFNPSRKTSEKTYLAGIRFMPKKTQMTIRSNIIRSEENDLGFKNVQTTLDTLLNFNIDQDTFVESNYKFVNRSKNSYEEGYNSRIGKITVTKRF